MTTVSPQRRVTELEEQISNLEYLLSDQLPGKERRDISVQVQETDVHFSVVRSEVSPSLQSPLLHEVLQVLQCRSCPVTYTKANTNRGNGMNLNSGVFTSPVNGSFYFQVSPTQER